MQIRQVTPRYSVSPQIAPEDLPVLRDQGFTTVICNRPDEENPAELQSDRMADAAKAAGLAFVVLPLTHQTMTPENIQRQNDVVNASVGPVLAYCASGTRCTVIWSLARAAEGVPADDILQTAAEAGYDLSGLRPRLEQR
ncbi:TIGR01244 family sulfur transferase [Pseudooceanicola sp.]|uniref:TIGR01244 family sulfur transferase n=1 Tax=Pseudooceanicola sp. TaxID=1914328 RepID=UPI004059BCA6